MAQSAKSGCTLFVQLPGSETLALRHLPGHLSTDLLKSKLELVAGIHGNACHVIYGGVTLAGDQDLDFGGTLRNGGVVKINLPEQLLCVYESICGGNLQKIRDTLSPPKLGRDQTTGSVDEVGSSLQDKLFFALLVACRKGHREVVQALTAIDSDGRWKNEATPYGHTLAHVAAASDQVSVLSYLMERGASCHSRDSFGQSQLDVAVEFGAYTCERQLRQSTPSKRKPLETADEKTPRKESATRKVCWADTQRTTSEKQSGKNVRSSNKRQLSVQSFDLMSCYSSGPGVLSGTSFSPSRQSSSCSGASRRSPTRSTSTRSDSPQKTTSSRTSEVRVPHSHKKHTTESNNHKTCTNRKPFMAYRTVAKEEWRPVAVEFVPLETANHTFHKDGNIDIQCPAAPCSSLNNSLEDLSRSGDPETEETEGSEASSDFIQNLTEREKILQKREELKRRYSRARNTSYRTQSAKYYRTKYHEEVDEIVVPRARPATAGPRYREWKTWLLDKMEEEGQRELLNEQNSAHQQTNERAFKKWLSRKQREELYDDETSSDDDDDKTYSAGYSEENDRAFRKWLDNKKVVFDKMDKQRVELRKQECDNSGPRDVRDRKITVFELGSFGDKPLPPAKHSEYMRAYQGWLDTRTKYENWKRKKGIQDKQSKPLTSADIAKMRGTLMLDGMTYQEWLGLKERERSAAKLNVHNIGNETDLTMKRKK